MIIYFLLLIQLVSKNVIALTDFDGTNIPKHSTKIAALTPSIAESIYELDSSEKLVAITDFTSIPNTVSDKIANIGPFNRINIEKLVSLKPDLAIASRDGNDRETVEKIKLFKIPIVLVDSHTLKDVIRSQKIIAETVDKSEHYKLKNLESLLQVTRPKKLKKVFIQVGFKPLVTVSNKSFVSELITLAGGNNIFNDSKISYPTVSTESVIERNPDYILILPMSDNDPAITKSITHWNQFKNITAVKHSKIFTLKTDSLTKPGLRLVSTYETIKKVFQ